VVRAELVLQFSSSANVGIYILLSGADLARAVFGRLNCWQGVEIGVPAVGEKAGSLVKPWLFPLDQQQNRKQRVVVKKQDQPDCA
jgi:hypothetical protein